MASINHNAGKDLVSLQQEPINGQFSVEGVIKDIVKLRPIISNPDILVFISWTEVWNSGADSEGPHPL